MYLCGETFCVQTRASVHTDLPVDHITYACSSMYSVLFMQIYQQPNPLNHHVEDDTLLNFAIKLISISIHGSSNKQVQANIN